MPLDLKLLEQHFFPFVEKPDRYTGSEMNLPELPTSPDLRVALAFPDLYDLGMSYLGLRLLLHCARIAGVACERVFMPWFDALQKLRALNLPLFTLESRTPLKELDLLGFNLQYELHATNILAMLDLGGVPLRADQRGEDDPIVIAGGPLALHPEPFAPFFEAIALGDGEELFPEILSTIKECKQQGRTRRQKIRALGDLPGVYLPSYYEPQYSDSGLFAGFKAQDTDLPAFVQARITLQLLPDYYSPQPLVPQLETTHNRLILEIARGCSRGCRFCAPGFSGRPVREKPIAQLLQEMETGLEATGYAQVSLLSLSTGDYSRLEELLTVLEPRLHERQVSLSFPSLRPDRFTAQLADRAAAGSRTGLTLAPEAATPRLRAAINKETSDEDLLQAVRLAFERGWKSVKLYFMIGLPTETEEDLHALADLVKRAARLGKEFGGRSLNVSLSPFTPKPHTPFEREGQLPLAEMRRRISMLRAALGRYHFLRLEIRDPEIALVEAALARGDRRTAAVIEASYRQGGRFDAWSDGFSFDRWQRAFQEAGLNIQQCASAIPSEAQLPWGHLGAGVSDEFLQSEREAATLGNFTPDCRRDRCQLCGLHLHPDLPCPEIPQLPAFVDTARVAATKPLEFLRYRLQYRRDARARFISHLDVLGVLERGLRRLGVPIEFTVGMKPHPRLIASPPLAVGLTSQKEYLDFGLAGAWAPELSQRLQQSLPQGFALATVKPVIPGTPNLGSLNLFLYCAKRIAGIQRGDLSRQIAALWEAKEIPLVRTSPKRARALDARPLLWRLEEGSEGSLWIGLRSLGGPMPRVSDILTLATEASPEDVIRNWEIERTGMWWENDGERCAPFEPVKTKTPSGEKL